MLEQHNIVAKDFVVAVSGGADSLALTYLLSSWAKINAKNIIAITVEHGLREDSLAEAEYVSELMKKENIEHHILKWDGKKPEANIEDIAREVRYSLLIEFCKSRNIENIFVGHHKYDQVETFLMRLQRGSGLDGLSSMEEVSSREDINIIRPLLSLKPELFKQYLNSKNIEWKEDYSNQDEKFLRVKIRKNMDILSTLGISSDKIYKAAKALSSTKDFIEEEVSKFCKNNIEFVSPFVAKIDFDVIREAHREMLFRVLSNLIKKIGDSKYIPRADDVLRICSSIKKGEKQSRTLGGCEILFSENNIFIFPELGVIEDVSKEKMSNFIEKNQNFSELPYKVKKFLFYKHMNK